LQNTTNVFGYFGTNSVGSVEIDPISKTIDLQNPLKHERREGLPSRRFLLLLAGRLDRWHTFAGVAQASGLLYRRLPGCRGNE